MIPVLNQIEQEDPTWEGMCDRLGRVLGLDHPVPSCVLRRARASDSYAVRLVISRGSAALLKDALLDPGNHPFKRPDDVRERSPLELGASLLGSLGKWLSEGARLTSKEVLEQRMGICRRCPHLTDPPDTMSYRVALVGASDPRVCSLCGCVAARKARLATESCPARFW